MDTLTPSDIFADCIRPSDAVFETALAKADAIVVFGNNGVQALKLMAERAAKLYHDKFAPKIIISGGVLDTKGMLEVDRLHLLLRIRGVPNSAIHRETRATNTKENAFYSRALAQKIRGFPKKPKIILVSQRYSSRRAMMSMAKQWPESFVMSSPICSIGTPLELWETCTLATKLVRSETLKIPVYAQQGDIVQLDESAHRRRINHAVAKDLKTRFITPRAQPSVF